MTFSLKFQCGVMKVGNSHVLTIPKIVVDNYGWKKGERVDVILNENGMFISKESKEPKQKKKRRVKRY